MIVSNGKLVSIFCKQVLSGFLTMGFLFSVFSQSYAQKRKIDLGQAIEIAWQNNLGLQASELRIEQRRKLEKTAFEMEKTGVYYNYDENNLTENGNALNVYGVGQTFSFPSVYGNQKKLQQNYTELQRAEHEIDRTQLAKEVAQAYYETLFQLNRAQQLTSLDSLYQSFATAASRRYDLGEVDYMEKLSAESIYLESQTNLHKAILDVEMSYQRLRTLLQLEEDFEIVNEPLTKLSYDSLRGDQFTSGPGLKFQNQLLGVVEAKVKVEKSRLWPDLQAEYFLGRSRGEDAVNFNGYQFGLGIPLFGGAQRSRIQAARIALEIQQKQIANYRLQLHSRQEQLKTLLQKYEEAVNHQARSLRIAKEIVQMAEKSYLSDETDYHHYIESRQRAERINLNYLEDLNRYNQAVLEIRYLIDP